MDTLLRTIEFMSTRSDTIWRLTQEHFVLVMSALAIAVVVGLVVGLAITYHRPSAALALGICQVLMTIPSIAMLGFLLTFFGIGFQTGLVALTLYSLLPIVRNTYTGIREIPPSILESAEGMGMSEWSRLVRIKIPLALPVVMAGIRTAAVLVVGIGAIASYIGAGGLGELIFHGIARTQPHRILAGATMVAAIAVTADLLLGRLEERMSVK